MRNDGVQHVAGMNGGRSKPDRSLVGIHGYPAGKTSTKNESNERLLDKHTPGNAWGIDDCSAPWRGVAGIDRSPSVRLPHAALPCAVRWSNRL